MTKIALFGDKRIRSRLKNAGLKHRVLEPNDENRAMVREYERLAADINAIPQRIKGLRQNFRGRDLPAQVERLLTKREKDMERLIEMEKTLFPAEA